MLTQSVFDMNDHERPFSQKHESGFNLKQCANYIDEFSQT